MKSWFLNFGHDVYDQAIRERITDIVQRSPSRLLVLALPSRVRSPILNCATSNQRADWRERATEVAILDWVVFSLLFLSFSPFLSPLPFALPPLFLSLSPFFALPFFIFGRGMRGPERGHVKDTTALLWEELSQQPQF